MRSHQGSLTRTCRILRRQKRDARWRWKCRRCSESASPRILGRRCFFGFRCGALDHRSEHPGRWWVETLRFMKSTCKRESSMKTTEENNKKLVLEAFDRLFNKRG